MGLAWGILPVHRILRVAMASLSEAFNNELLPYVLLAMAVAILLHVVLGGPTTAGSSSVDVKGAEEEEEEKDPQRAFTIEQLRKYDGVVPEDAPKFDLDLGKIHIAIKSVVYDVTKAAEFYGPGAGYHCFAGREASVALAKLSFEESALAEGEKGEEATKMLSAAELDQLQDWINKFEMKGYPVVGRVVKPAPCKENMSPEELLEFNGTGPVPEGRVDPLLYVGCNGKVFDVTFGGFDMYKPGAGYHRFAGLDASRALAKMSFEPEDVGSRDCSDLTPAQVKVLEDWAFKFEHKKKYPVVALLAPFEPPTK